MSQHWQQPQNQQQTTQSTNLGAYKASLCNQTVHLKHNYNLRKKTHANHPDQQDEKRPQREDENQT